MGVKINRYENGTITQEIAYVGLTVGRGSHYLGDGDTDYYAIVWDVDARCPRHVGHGWSMPEMEIDPTPEVAAAYQAWQDAQAAAREIARQEAAAAQAAYELTLPKRGRTVRVTAKRAKVPYGATGTIKATHDGQWGLRLLVTWDDGREDWTAASNVEVVVEELAAA